MFFFVFHLFSYFLLILLIISPLPVMCNVLSLFPPSLPYYIFFSLPIAILPAIDCRSVRTRFHLGNRQMFTPDLLELLKGQIPEDGIALLGLTAMDLYPDPKWNFVFGQASLSDRVGMSVIHVAASLW